MVRSSDLSTDNPVRPVLHHHEARDRQIQHLLCIQAIQNQQGIKEFRFYIGTI